MIARVGGRWSLLFIVVNVLIVLFLVAALLVAPIAVDQIHMDDSVLLANVAWRGVNGLIPVIDYPHFYGGFAEYFAIASFKLFGATYKSIDYAFVMLFGVSAVLGSALYWKRLTLAQASLLTALGAALILSLDPLEAFQHFKPGHSFVYNHVGVVLMLALTVFACRPIDDRRAERLSAGIAGGVLYVVILLKTTLGLIGLSIILACLIQKRWASAALVVAGAGAAMLVLDPGMTRALGSLDLLLASDAAAEAGGLRGRLIVTSLMIETQAVAIAVVLILTIALWRRAGRDSLPLIASLFVCGLGYGAAMLTTGGNPQHKLLPLLTVAAILIGKALTEGSRAGEVGRTHRLLIGAVPVVIAGTWLLPAIATSGIALSHSFRHADAALVRSGPLARYVVFDSVVPDPGADRLAAATAAARRRVDRGPPISDRDEYIIFADGMNLLRQVDDVASLGVVANGRMFDFTAPLQSKVVASFPVWPTPASLGSTRVPLARDVDLVMMLDDLPSLELVGGPLRARMGQAFRPCRRSTFWTLYARRELADRLCGAPSGRQAAVHARSAKAAGAVGGL